ncbi:hypothetical protein MTR67_052693 [Solanum verrucosum]|uniref:Integrase catalytic domain-containing protein n=1 Tax=Solanum verrucosum TaxID=315347 RepID=A0AAF0V9L5_SOLVR|nr:hypothetical protein MTR67_052693 [Solanum verrucosum]
MISDRGAQFTAQFWKSFHKGLGSKVNLSTAFHPQTDGQVEHTIQTLEDTLRSCVIYFKGPDLVHQAMEKVKVIQERLKTTQSRQKSYTDVRRKELEFEVDNWDLAVVHSGFHISMLKKCMGDPSLIIPTEDTGIKDSLSYEEILVQILDRQVRKLRTKEVASVKVLWRNQFVEEATWKTEEDMKKR